MGSALKKMDMKKELQRKQEAAFIKVLTDMFYHLGLHVALGHIEPFRITAEQEQVIRINDDIDTIDPKVLNELERREKYNQNMKNRRIIARNIRKYREQKALTQREVASVLRIPIPTLSGYETAKTTPSPERVKQIAKVLNVDISDLTRDARSI